jgi:hypothetical protein
MRCQQDLAGTESVPAQIYLNIAFPRSRLID